jgi:HPt (histidine-containing phosphotransfer) domain-containing protein
MDEYVTNPIDPDVLINTIRVLCTPSISATSAAPAPPINSISTAPKPAPIAAEPLLRRCRGKTALAESLLGKFQETVEAQLHQLQDALAQRDTVLGGRLAHSIKGASANLSADAVSKVAGELEHLAKSEEWEAAEHALAELQASVDLCVRAMPDAIDQIRMLGSPATVTKGTK